MVSLLIPRGGLRSHPQRGHPRGGAAGVLRGPQGGVHRPGEGPGPAHLRQGRRGAVRGGCPGPDGRCPAPDRPGPGQVRRAGRKAQRRSVQAPRGRPRAGHPRGQGRGAERGDRDRLRPARGRAVPGVRGRRWAQPGPHRVQAGSPRAVLRADEGIGDAPDAQRSVPGDDPGVHRRGPGRVQHRESTSRPWRTPRSRSRPRPPDLDPRELLDVTTPRGQMEGRKGIKQPIVRPR